MFSVAALTGNAALDVLVGLFFLYFLLSIVCSAVNEGIAATFNLRAKNLERAICSLLDGQANADSFFEHPRIQALFKPGGRVLFKNGRKPSYIPSRAFALTLLDKFVHSGSPKDVLARAEAAVKQVPSDRIRRVLQDALDDADGDFVRFRGALERSFDEVMDRASGWYKRRVQLILFIVGFALVVAINADSFSLGQRLWKDDALRAAVVAQANKTVQAGRAACAKTNSSGPTKAADCVDEVKTLGLPFGWSHANAPHSFWSGLGKSIGLLVTIFALSLGAPFWFDLLGKVANLRGSGPPTPGAESKPTTT